MNIVISNDIKIEEPNESIIEYCKNKLTLDNPDYIIAQKLGRYLGNIEKQIKLYVRNGNTLILPFGCLKDVWALKGNSSYTLKFHDFRGSCLKGNINLYDYQQNAVNALKSGKNGVLQAPCGSGKTQIGLALIKLIGGKALWLTHTKKLLEQSKQRCEMYYQGDFGTITEGHINIGGDITFATVQTMCKLDPSVYKDEFDIVIVDECHHCVGTPTKVMQFYKILTNCNSRYKYGLSATLSRADNLISCVFYLLGDILYTIPQSAVGDKIIKATHIKVDVDINYNMTDYLDVDGTLNNNSLLNMLSNNEERNQLIINNVVSLDNKENKQLILCHRIKQCEYLYNNISSMGIPCNLIIGKVKDKERDYNGRVIIATYSLAKEGLDIPTLNILHLATPQKNESVTLQSVGRIERNIEGKKTPQCYDYVDNNIMYCVQCYKKRRRMLNKKS